MAKRSNGLYTKLDHPLSGSAKQACLVYGTRGPGVDLGVDCDAWGTIFLSDVAIREAAEVAGFVVNEEGIQLEEDLAHMTHRNQELALENQELRDQLDALSVVFARGAAETRKGAEGR